MHYKDEETFFQSASQEGGGLWNTDGGPLGGIWRIVFTSAGDKIQAVADPEKKKPSVNDGRLFPMNG